MTNITCSASFDWGYNAPGCIGWFLHLPDGHYHCVREYKFQQTSVEDVATRVLQYTKDLGVKRLAYLVGDPACWAKTGHGRGESIAETMARYRLPVKRGDNDRVSGWQRVHDLLRLDPQGVPWLTFDLSCTYLRRTIPAAVSDPKDPDDVDTTIDDHGLDMLRYWALSRPAPTRLFQPPKREPGSVADMLAQLRNPKRPVLGADQVRVA